MKKYFKLVIAALLVLPMGACSGDDSLTEAPSQTSRAADDGTDDSYVDEGGDEVPESWFDEKFDPNYSPENDLCGLSQTQFRIDSNAHVIEVTSEEPFCIEEIEARDWIGNDDPLGEDETSWGIMLDECEMGEFREDPTEYVASGEVGFVRFERDDQCHIRVFFPEHESTKHQRDCFIKTYNPKYRYFQGYGNYNWCWIHIVQDEEIYDE